MPRRKKETFQDRLKGVKDRLEMKASNSSATSYIPSIIEFCESKSYLGLPYLETPVILYPMQRIILKAFYRKSPGNFTKEMEFTEEEIELLREHKLYKESGEDRGDVLGKIQTDDVFRELILVWGRRSGKDFISSIIACYEAMKLLETPGGDPFATYNLQRGGNEIAILTIANSASQANIAFNEIQAKLVKSPYFDNKYLKDGITQGKIYLLTPADRRDNEERSKKGLPLTKGSVMIAAGHSNSDSMLGMQTFVLLLDEVATYKNTDGASGGRRIYEAMLPSLNTFVRNSIDENGEVIVREDGKPEKVFDSKVISISSPRGKEGILYEMFRDADETPERLVCRLPTWVVNSRYDKKSLRKSFSQFNDERFMMEFGADFSGTAGTKFFVEEHVDACFTNKVEFVDSGVPGIVYFAHLDPASNSNRYALAICHKEVFLNEETNRADFRIIVDHLKLWVPSAENPINIEEIDNYVLNMNRRFHIGMVTYDDHHSYASIQKMKRFGIPCKMTKYTNAYKMQVFKELETLVNEHRIVMPWDDNLYNEMVGLSVKYNSGRGFSLHPDKESESPNDDAVDAIAGATYNCLAVQQTKLPGSRLASVPLENNGQGRVMRSMQGTPYSERAVDQLRARQGMNQGYTFLGR
jgi:hypothetical protein